MIRAIWTHGGPTSAFLHIVIAICLLVPRLLLESRLIENGNLSRGEWAIRLKTDFIGYNFELIDIDASNVES